MAGAFEALEQAQQIELLAAKIYRAAAEHFADRPDWGSLFTRLAGEEEQHALRVKMLAGRLLKDSTAFRNTDLAELDFAAILDEGATWLEQLHRPGPLGLDETLAHLSRMEGLFAAAHAHLLLATADASAREFFEALAAGDRAHRELLERTAAGSPAL